MQLLTFSLTGQAPSLSVGSSVECVRVFKGHSRSVTDLAWSQHQPFMIASAAMDGTCQVQEKPRVRSVIALMLIFGYVLKVWNIVKGEGIATFCGHQGGRIFALVWSQLDPNMLISGSDDQTVRCWNITDLPFKPPAGKIHLSWHLLNSLDQLHVLLSTQR